MKPGLDSGDSKSRKNRVVVSAAEECSRGSAGDQNSGMEMNLKGNWGWQQDRKGKIKVIL